MKISKTKYFKRNKFYPDDKLIKGNSILCYKCRQREAECQLIGGMYSIGRCYICQNIYDTKSSKNRGRLGGLPEFVPERIKDERQQYFNTMLQPEREGVPSKEFVEAYPEKARKIFKDKINKAEYVYKDISGWNHREKSL